MHRTGGASWRFVLDSPCTVTKALLVRDSLGLCSSFADLPPRTMLAIRDHQSLLTEHERPEADTAWRRWWDSILTNELHRDDADRVAGSLVERAARERLLMSDLEPLPALLASPTPEQQTDLAALENEARLAASRSDLKLHLQQLVPWKVIRDCVHELAAQQRADPSALTGRLVVLPGDGPWWCPAAPGLVLVSANSLRDPDMVARVVRAALTPRPR